MDIGVKSATYTQIKDGKENQFEFDFATNLKATSKMMFVNSVVDTIVDETNKRYNGIIKDLIFDFTIIDMFTNIDVSDIRDSADSVSAIENFLAETNIVEIVTANVSTQLMESLRIAVDENIQYKTGVNPNNVSSAISNLLEKFEKTIEGVDVSELVDFANKVGGISDNVTVDKIVDAYSRSEAFKKVADGMAERDEHIAEIVATAKETNEKSKK